MRNCAVCFRVKYDTFDILTDDEVRQGLKKFSDWPTYPQIYVNGEMLGGLDIIKVPNACGSVLHCVLTPFTTDCPHCPFAPWTPTEIVALDCQCSLLDGRLQVTGDLTIDC